jgi:predicted nucleic acid-binding protein
MVRVIDASVAIKWLVREDGSDKALEVLKDVVSAPAGFAVPELFYFELAHVFHRLFPHASEKQASLLAGILSLGLHRFSMTADLLAEMRFFQKKGLSGYDSAYVALAKMLQGRWVTFDRQAHGRVKRFGVSEVL